MHRLCLTLTFIISVCSLHAQDLGFVKRNISRLASPELHGRGYVKKGDIKASAFLSEEFKKFGLLSFKSNYFQEYSFNVNTFPGKMDVSIDGKKLEPGRDFLIGSASSGIRGTYTLVPFGLREAMMDTSDLKALFRADNSGKFIMLDTAGWGKSEFRIALRNAILGNLIRAKGIMEVADTGMIYSVRTFKNDFTRLTVRRKSLPARPSEIQLNISQKLISHTARNVIGYIPGETDTFIVFTAHYDHLGRMGKDTYFPGANDNASGTSMVLDLIRALSKKQNHRYSYAFMLFSGEEAGLLGSRHYVAHPLFPLSKIKQVLNFDMVGTGSGGVNVYNGTVLNREFALLDSINRMNNFGVRLNIKSTSRGSDHYPFHEKGIPSLFILTDGKEVGYHVPGDRPEKLTFAVYEKLFRIVYQYIEAKENGEVIYRPDTDR